MAQEKISTLLSDVVTKSPGPLSDTCNFSISTQSLIKGLAAFLHALTITFMFAEESFIYLFFSHILSFLYPI